MSKVSNKLTSNIINIIKYPTIYSYIIHKYNTVRL